MATVLTRKSIGIEIGPAAITAVLMQTQRGADRVLAWHRLSCAGRPVDGDVLTAALEPLLAREEAAGAATVVSLPADRFFFRRLSAPFREPRKLRQVIPFELEPSLPAPVESLVFDFRRLDDSVAPQILAASLAREQIADLLAQLHSLRLEPERITVGGLDVVHQIGRPGDAPEHFAGLHLAAGAATLFLVRRGEVQEVRNLALDDDGRRMAERLHQTCQAVIDTEGRPFVPEQIRVTGFEPDHERLMDALAARTGLPVQRVDLARTAAVDTANEPSANPWHPGMLNGALALALAAREREAALNLRQGPFAVKDFWSRHRPALIRTGILTALVLVLAVGQAAISLHFKARRVRQIDREITAVFRDAFPDVTRIVDPVAQMQTRIRDLREAALLPGMGAERPRAIDLLGFISRQISARMDVELTRLVMGPENITLSGHTSGFDTVDDIKNRLQNGGLLAAVTISAANIDKQSGRVRFTLTAVPRETS